LKFSLVGLDYVDNIRVPFHGLSVVSTTVYELNKKIYGNG
jgi:hypothetical protein